MPCLVRRLDNTVAFLTDANISRAVRVETPRPLPALKSAISKALVRQPSLKHPTTPGPPAVKNPYHTGPPPGLPPGKNHTNTGPPPGVPPIKSSSKFDHKVGEKRNISSQELKIIIDSIKEIRNKIRYGNLTRENKLDYQILLRKFNRKIC